MEKANFWCSFVSDPAVTGYPPAAPFDPRCGGAASSGAHRLESMVKRSLNLLEVEGNSVTCGNGSKLAELIRTGDHVVIKPNLVTHRHYLGPDALLSTVTHGSVVRPFVDYALKAVGPTGHVTIADCPIESTDFARVINVTGLRSVVEELRGRGNGNLSLIDLRPQQLVEADDGGFEHRTLSGDPEGYKTVDLEGQSLLAPLDSANTHYYTLADASVDHFDPRFRGASVTDRYHSAGTHRYVVARTILNADVVINIAKMKTHCKAGLSLSLKNLIGIIHDKECMPHHRPGSPPYGDSFHEPPAVYYTLARRLYRALRRSIAVHRLPGFKGLRDHLRKEGILVGQHLEHGNWSGNDTIWRTALDINRIAMYADRSGVMKDRPQRRFLHVIDGVIGQEGDGPAAGWPVLSKIVITGTDTVVVDAVAALAMGADPSAIPMIREASRVDKWPLTPLRERAIEVARALDPPVVSYRLPQGWRQRSEE